MEKETITRLTSDEIKTMIERRFNIKIKRMTLSRHGARIWE